jgi:hypothetical protein
VNKKNYLPGHETELLVVRSFIVDKEKWNLDVERLDRPVSPAWGVWESEWTACENLPAFTRRTRQETTWKQLYAASLGLLGLLHREKDSRLFKTSRRSRR